ncbi:hypothetical protein B0J15DRAFT_498441 [Fusarium solani]|uniref:GATA-type domain-containing protein n=1 Tax=Fusarium solani TaxID=169388 RepID=A0A9P9GZU9_FUSSL|nr:uncharacterized protein B0J15DRAFT_498441 [Fusarium solani]KAH7248401.1 hypothetical protein B0J15DRAFT_498441 [Fusarium solani]
METSHREPPAMAMTMLIMPSTHHALRPSVSSDYHHSSSSASISNMISSIMPQKPANGNNSSNRRPLPSISELIQDTKLGPPLPGPPSSTQPCSKLSSSFEPIPQSFSKAGKHSSPQPLHPASSHRLPLTSRPLLPLSDCQAGLSAKPDIPPQQHHPQQQRSPRAHYPFNVVYTHPHPPPPTRVYQPGQQPPSQMRLPVSRIPSKHAVPPHVSKLYNPWEPPGTEKGVCAPRARHDATIGSCSHKILNFSEVYTRITQEQHGAHPIPSRLPTKQDISDILGNIERIKRHLEQVRSLLQASSQNERAREAAKIKSPYEEDHDVPMHEDAMKPQHGMTEANTRLRRAAPLDRCHCCNRVNTPEWRRGPDGARTLCNACGLRYAKLRKQQLEARSIHVKPGEAHSY